MFYNYYELFIINKCFNFFNIKKNIFNLINYIVYNKGVIMKIEFCGERNFSYLIKKNYKGYYIFIYFYFCSFYVKKLFNFLKNNKNIIRFLIVLFKKNNNYISSYFYNKISK